MEIYGISESNTGELRYIGKTEKYLPMRLAQHQQPAFLKDNTHKNNWIKNAKKNGVELVIHSIQKLDTIEDLNVAEIYWIKFFRDQGCRLTNGADGGPGGAGHRGHTHTLESRAKISIGRRGFKLSLESNAKGAAKRLGSKRTEQTRIKMSAAQKGRSVSLECREKLRQLNLGKKDSEETKARKSIAQKERWQRCRDSQSPLSNQE